jgi:hypothetical protein
VLPLLPSIFLQVLLIAKELGFLSVGQVSLDGSKIKANASKHHSAEPTNTRGCAALEARGRKAYNDYLKIDGEFIRNLTQDAADQQIVKAIAQMAVGLGKQTIAEFVEDDVTLDLLREYGVDLNTGACGTAHTADVRNLTLGRNRPNPAAFVPAWSSAGRRRGRSPAERSERPGSIASMVKRLPASDRRLIDAFCGLASVAARRG